MLTKHRKGLFLAVIFCTVLMTALAVDAASGIYVDRGNISAIDLVCDTVVVEVPTHGEMMTVGGPLTQDAKQMRNGRSVQLSDFNVGDTVLVRWQSTEQGHRIYGLTGR